MQDVIVIKNMPRKKITNTNSSYFYHEPAVWMVGLSYLAGMVIVLLMNLMVTSGPSVQGLSAAAGNKSQADPTGMLARLNSQAQKFQGTSSENLIVNGSFELPVTRAVSSTTNISNPQFGWEVTYTTLRAKGVAESQPAALELLSGFKDWESYDGAQFARLDVADVKARSKLQRSLVTIAQDVPTQNKLYSLCFWYAPQPGTDAEDNVMTVRWNGEVVREISASGLEDEEPVWQQSCLDVQGADLASRLEFVGEGTENGRGNLLDQVVLTAK